MNRRLTTLLVGVGLMICSQAYGQTALPPSIKSSSSISQPDQATIGKFVQNQVASLGAQDAAEQAKARDAIANGLSGDPAPSAAFVEAYTKAVNDGLVPVLNNPSQRVRLNAAIAGVRLVERSGSIQLKPFVQKLVTDKAESVVLWGVKGHRALLPVVLKGSPSANEPLLKELVPAIKNRLGGEISQDAYDALRMDIVTQRKLLTPEMIKAVIPQVQDLLAARIAQYESGVPQVPVVDTMGTSFLVDGDVWRDHTKEQQVKSAQLIADLLTLAAARVADLEKDREHKDEIIKTIQLVARGVQVVGEQSGKAYLVTAALPLTKIEANTDSATISKNVDELVKQIGVAVPGVKKTEFSLKPLSVAQK